MYKSSGFLETPQNFENNLPRFDITEKRQNKRKQNLLATYHVYNNLKISRY